MISDLQISAAKDGGFIVRRCDEDHEDELVFAGTLDQCLAYMREKMGPQVAEKPNVPDADGWITWEGGECPVSPNTKVDVRFRGAEAERWTWGRPMGEHPGDIIAYRVLP